MRRLIVIGRAKKLRRIVLIADELFELNHPEKKDSQAARELFTAPIIKKGDRYGKWFYFPWSNQLVQYPNKKEHQRLLASRNRDLITDAEQRKLRTATILYAGLSVGSHILEQATHMGIGGTVILADPDIVSITNLNRINAGMAEVGMRKTDVAGIRLSELNPYVKQVHFPEGITVQNSKRITRRKLNLIYEHVDDLPIKISLRRLAKQKRIPLIMATDVGDRSLIDVERYDQKGTVPFLGTLTTKEIRQLEKGILPVDQKITLIKKIIGEENISPRFASSLDQIGVTLSGIAQLGTTAAAGGAYATVAGRDILLGDGPATGRSAMSPQEVMNYRAQP